MPPRRILVVEDDVKTAASIRLYLDQAGFAVDVAHDGAAGLARARAGRYDLILLDLMLPGMDGTRICRNLRSESSVPILMLTARSTTADRIEGLEMGADDYLTKPFSMRELMARVRAVMRRTHPQGVAGPGRLRFGALEVDLMGREVSTAGEPVTLTRTEFDLLSALVRNPGQVHSRASLIRKALGSDFEGRDRTIDAHIMNLRRKIEPDPANPSLIKTVYGVGYRFDPPEEDET